MQFVVKYCFGLLCLFWFVSCSKDDCMEKHLTNRTIIVYMTADNDLSEDAYSGRRATTVRNLKICAKIKHGRVKHLRYSLTAKPCLRNCPVQPK